MKKCDDCIISTYAGTDGYVGVIFESEFEEADKDELFKFCPDCGNEIVVNQREKATNKPLQNTKH